MSHGTAESRFSTNVASWMWTKYKYISEKNENTPTKPANRNFVPYKFYGIEVWTLGRCWMLCLGCQGWWSSTLRACRLTRPWRRLLGAYGRLTDSSRDTPRGSWIAQIPGISVGLTQFCTSPWSACGSMGFSCSPWCPQLPRSSSPGSVWGLRREAGRGFTSWPITTGGNALSRADGWVQTQESSSVGWIGLMLTKANPKSLRRASH
ncbi:hypothetical protein AAFF_G00183350 [Aldrovandia affinis]|uniref:Uncharacterized protein n=1 Tax=Aldrovandia affinis TaxID=143900 RepID=A0AAD7RKF5_9TELE|nr:hypothetical protein AAFF_G00183350 [Aldrovandia affinis]